MWILAFTFALTFGLVCGTYWLLVVRPESQSQHALSRRLWKPRAPKQLTSRLVRESKRLSSIPALEIAFGRAGLVSNRLQGLLDSADVSTSVGRVVLGSLLLGAIAATAAWFGLRQAGVSLI